LFFISGKFFSIFGHKNPGSGSGSVSNEYGSETLSGMIDSGSYISPSKLFWTPLPDPTQILN
jgi:hypothetical protein